MRSKIAPAAVIAVALLFSPGCETVLSSITEQLETGDGSQPADGLREALRVGTGRAVSRLGARGGYLDDQEVRIGVPQELELADQALRLVGRRALVDEFVLSMNRAAEAAAPLAQRVFVDAIFEMTFDDAMRILRGQRHEATDYLVEHAGPRLGDVFRPLVAQKLDEVGATRSFGELLARIEELPLVDKPVFALDEYVTGEALDGLFLVIAREEERIRADPVARTTELLRRWFGDSNR
ncbi:MAG: DUF4197 domain-containing protein [Acidobacteriota bacterium]|nr:DUF4197 domain-containing protein [Acidobacteriota bacterium]